MPQARMSRYAKKGTINGDTLSLSGAFDLPHAWNQRHAKPYFHCWNRQRNDDFSLSSNGMAAGTADGQSFTVSETTDSQWTFVQWSSFTADRLTAAQMVGPSTLGF